jgi:hypothetical protein
MSEPELGAIDHYVRDLLHLLIERAREAKASREALPSGSDSFETGRHMAYYEMVSTALGNLKSFGLSPSRFDVTDDFSPDRELT